MNKFRAELLFGLLVVLVCGAAVGLAVIPNNTIKQNAGASLPTYNATGGGYYVGGVNVIDAAREADFTAVDSDEYFLNTVNKTDIFAYPQTEASYIIWSDGGTPPVYYAKNGQTGQITSQNNYSTLINSILAPNVWIHHKPGTYVKTIAAGFALPSNIKITLDPGAIITFDNNINANAAIFTNSDTTNGNINIRILGGTLDGNYENQASGIQYGVNFTQVTKSEVKTSIDYFTGADVCFIGSEVNYKNLVFEDRSPTGYDTEVIDEFSTGWTSLSGTISYPTTDYISGGSCIKVDNVGTYVRIRKDLPSPIDLSSTNIQFSVYMKWNTGNAGYLNLGFFHIASGHSYQPVRPVYTLNLLPGGAWYRFIMPKSSGNEANTLTPAEWGAIDRIWLTVTQQVGGDWVEFDKLEIIPTPERGIITFTFDDSFETDFTEAAKYMSNYGYLGTTFTKTQNIGTANCLSTAQLQALAEMGWDIASHAQDTTLTTADQSFREYVMRADKNYLEKLVGERSLYLAYPGGAVNSDVTSLAKKYYRISRAIQPLMESIPVRADPSLVNAWSIKTSTNSVVSTKAQIDLANKYKSWQILYCHKIGSGGDISVADFQSIVDYCYSTGAEVLSMDQVYNKYLKPITTDNINTQTFKLTTSEFFWDILAANTSGVHALIAGDGALQTITTGITTPDYSRSLTVTATNNAAPSGTVTITGYDSKGYLATESFTIVAGGTATGDIPFMKVTQFTIPAGVTAADSISIGTGVKIGLSNQIYSTADILKINKNGASQTIDTAKISTRYNTYNMDVIGIGAGDDFVIWYNTELNVIEK